MGLPAALACDVGVVKGAPVAVTVGARTDGLAVRETVLSFILVMTRRSPMVPPGVPSAGVEGVDHHGLSDQRSPRVPPGVPAVGGEGVDHHVRPAQSSPKVPPGSHPQGLRASTSMCVP